MSSLATFVLFFLFLFSLSAVQAQVPKTNPDISLNALFLARSSSEGQKADSEAPSGFHLQEAELRFTSAIDAYFRGDVTLAMHRESDTDEYHIEPEEAFVETLSIPALTLRVGKFYAYLGRHNSLHSHYFPFIDPPLTNEMILGEEGLNEVGLSAAYLTPAPWYLEVVTQVFSAENENLFASPTQDDVAGVLTIKNFWDLTKASTFEIDLGYGTGSNSFNGTTQLYNASLTYKWRPVEKSYNQSFSWTLEYLRADRGNASTDEQMGGISSWFQYQMSRPWWSQIRAEYLGLPRPDAGAIRKYSGLIAYTPTEFSAIRMQYDHISNPVKEDNEHRVSLQLNITMGTHPAHQY